MIISSLLRLLSFRLSHSNVAESSLKQDLQSDLNRFFAICNITSDEMAANSFAGNKNGVSSAGGVKNEIVLVSGCKNKLLLKFNGFGVSVRFCDLFLPHIGDIMKGPTTFGPDGILLENKEIFGSPTASVAHTNFHFIPGN